MQDVDKLVDGLGDALGQEVGKTGDEAANQQQRHRHDDASYYHDFPDLQPRRGEDLSPDERWRPGLSRKKGEGLTSSGACRKRATKVMPEIHARSRAT